MTIVAIVAGIVTLALLFKPFFGSLAGFLECLRYWLTPDIFSWLRGEFTEDWWAELKLGVWIGCGVLVGLGVHAALGKASGSGTAEPPATGRSDARMLPSNVSAPWPRLHQAQRLSFAETSRVWPGH